MPKVKYPKTYKKEKDYIKIPILSNGKFSSFILFKNGELKKESFAEHHTKESCWICCRAYNNRIGYSEKEVSKIIKKYFKNGKGKEEEKKQKKTK